MNERSLKLEVRIEEQDADDVRLDELTFSLREALDELPLNEISRPPAGDAPIDAKPGEAITIGTLALAVLPEVLPGVIKMVQNWLGEQQRIVVKAPNGAEIEFTSSKRYSAEEMLDIAKSLNQI